MDLKQLKVVAWLTDDGKRVATNETRTSAMPKASRDAFNIPLMRADEAEAAISEARSTSHRATEVIQLGHITINPGVDLVNAMRNLYAERCEFERLYRAEVAARPAVVEQADALSDERSAFRNWVETRYTHPDLVLQHGYAEEAWQARAIIVATRPVAPVPEGWRESLSNMRDASYTYSQYPEMAQAIFDDVIDSLDELETMSKVAPVVAAPVQRHTMTPELRAEIRAWCMAGEGDTDSDDALLEFLNAGAAPVQAAPEGWREFIENIARPGSEPLNSICSYRDNASRREHMGILRRTAQKLLAAAPAPGASK